MPVAVQMPQRREQKDPLDTILKGLNIAANIYGIKEARDKSSLLAKQSALEEQKFAHQQDKDEQASWLAADQAEEEGEYKAAQTKEALARADAIRSGRGTGGGDPEMRDLKKLIAQQQLAELQNKSATGTSDQNKVAGFAMRTLSAEKVFDELAATGYTGTGVGAEAQRSGWVPERAKSAEFKKLEQAQRNFLNAILRRESGASISAEERQSGDLQYFPLPGDPPEVLEQKKQNRLIAIAGLQAEAGPAFTNLRNSLQRQTSQAGVPQIDMNNRWGGISVLPNANASQLPQATALDDQIVKDAAAELIRRRGLKAAPLPKGKR